MRFTHHIVPLFVHRIHFHAVLDVALPVEIVRFRIFSITFVPSKKCRLIKFVVIPKKSRFLASVVQSYPTAASRQEKMTNKTENKWMASG